MYYNIINYINRLGYNDLMHYLIFTRLHYVT